MATETELRAGKWGKGFDDWLANYKHYEYFVYGLVEAGFEGRYCSCPTSALRFAVSVTGYYKTKYGVRRRYYQAIAKDCSHEIIYDSEGILKLEDAKEKAIELLVELFKDKGLLDK